jgi:3-hydroxy-9,10-secoandrosta-1,3,5(10)-triene-9,17-dione monooxygenase
MTAGPTVPALGREELLDRARALVPALRERAAETEQLRRVTDESLRAIINSQLLRIPVPKRFGGLDVDFSVFLDVCFELARGCGSSGWCYALWGVHAWWVGYYSPQVQEEVFADGPDTLLSTANFVVKSEAVPVPGGYRLSGHWQFSTGCDHVGWVITTGITPTGPVGMVVPRSDFSILQDTWHVSGLQGTGSKDIVIEDAFVPLHRTLAARESPEWGSPFQYHGQRRYSVPLGALLIWDLVAPGIGIAQSAVDEFTRRMYQTSGRARSAESPVVQVKVAESCAEIDAALALMHKDVEDAQSKGERGETLSPLDLTTYSRNKAYATRLAMQAVNRLYDLAGAHALYFTDPLQRIHRDVQAAGHRDVLVFDFVGQQYGRAILGLDPSGVVLRAPTP